MSRSCRVIQLFLLGFGMAMCLLTGKPVSAQVLLTFEGLTDSTPVTTEFAPQGVTFAHTTALTAGLGLNELEFPPKSGQNVVFDDGAALTGDFSTPVLNVSAYFTYSSRITLTIYDAANNALGSVSSAFASNVTSSGHTPNEFLRLSSTHGIARFQVAGDVSGSSLVMDNLSFTPQAVPEPSTLLFACGGLVGSAGFWTFKTRRNHPSRQSL